MTTPDSYDLLFKIVLVGDSGVGKSNLFSRFHKNEFSLESGTTLGVEFATKTMLIENATLKAQIWDTCGQEQFRALTKTYYKKAVGALVVYDITKKQTFDGIDKWYQDIKENAEEEVVLMLVGNKADLKHLREVETQQAAEIAKNKNMAFIETSALDSTNVEAAFQMIVQQIYTTFQKTKNPSQYQTKPIGEGESIVLKETKKPSGSRFRKLNCCKQQ